VDVDPRFSSTFRNDRHAGNNLMDENSPVISVQREGDRWVWTISAEDLQNHRMRILEQSNRPYATYETALIDAEAVLETLTTT
jgi:hypothetical protein